MRERIPKKDSIVALTPYGGMCIVLNNVVDKLEKILVGNYEYSEVTKCINVVKAEQRWAKKNKEKINRR